MTAAALAASGPILAQNGDGSGSDNPMLNTGSATATNGTNSAPPGELSALSLAYLDLVAGADGLDTAHLATPHPALDLDWSLGLRGSHVWGSTPTRNDVEVTPAVSASYQTSQWSLRGGISATLTASDQALTWVDDVSADLAGEVAISRNASASFSVDAAVQKENPFEPGLDDQIVDTPLEVDLGGEASLSQRLGKLTLTGGVEAGRRYVGDTLLIGDVTETNDDLSYYDLAGNLSASFELTPIVSPFVAASYGAQRFDAAPVSTGIKLDNVYWSGEAGIAANWEDVVTASASLGYQVTDFVDGSLTDLASLTYKMDVSAAPGRGLEVEAGLATTHNPGDPDNSVSASIDYEANGGVQLQATDRIALRGSVDWLFSVPVDTGVGATTWAWGAGADYQFNRHVALTLDYAFSSANDPVDGEEHAHSIGLGITFARAK